MRLYVKLLLIIPLLAWSHLYGMWLGDDPHLALQIMDMEQKRQQAHIKKVDQELLPFVAVTLESHPKAKDCIVCFERFSQQKACMVLACDPERNVSHRVCTECLADWRKKSNTCPTCRRQLEEDPLPVLRNVLKLLLSMSCCVGSHDE